jgi:hypothetical protein
MYFKRAKLKSFISISDIICTLPMHKKERENSLGLLCGFFPLPAPTLPLPPRQIYHQSLFPLLFIKFNYRQSCDFVYVQLDITGSILESDGLLKTLLRDADSLSGLFRFAR